MTAAEILADLGIEARSTAIGRFYARCPHCSDKRKPHNRNKRCLGITIDAQGVKYGCNNCEWTGGRFYNDQREARSLVRKPGHQHRDGGSFRNLYR